MLLLGLDIGTSSIKASIINTEDLRIINTVKVPEEEMSIASQNPGWAEQSPETWWAHTSTAIRALGDDISQIGAIGISYQMHGLVMVDEKKQVLRPSIIWCDSRSVDLGDEAFDAIGHEQSLRQFLNSPGNFTASKLAWVKRNEKATYDKTRHIMLPGDYIAMKLTGEITTSVPALSEGIFWNFRDDRLAEEVFEYFQLDRSYIPELKNAFDHHGVISSEVAQSLGLPTGISVTYKAGDQPNNALSLNVLSPGEVAATAGTSGVIYAVTDKLLYDSESRVNTFAHVNYNADSRRLGVLLCINGTGILNRWLKESMGNGLSYAQINELAAEISPGSEGVIVLPFGNGAERMLNNRQVGAHIVNVDLNRHDKRHIFRAGQEGIAFAFRYGLDMMKQNGISPRVIRAGLANMFLSPVFREAFVNSTGIPLELYENDGSVGAAIGAGIGAGIFKSFDEAFRQFKPVETINPGETDVYEKAYENWKRSLERTLN